MRTTLAVAERRACLGQARAEKTDSKQPVVAVEGTGRVSIAEGPIGSRLTIRPVGRSGCPLPEHR